MRLPDVSLIATEVFLLRRRVATWVLLGVWSALVLTFAYIVPYVTLTGDGADDPNALASMLPDQIVPNVIAGFPFYGGAIALMLGVLAVGSEFGWDTLKTLFSQRPGRGTVFAAKVGAIGVMLVPFVLAPFAVGAVASVTIALVEDAPVAAPSLRTLVEGVTGAWLVLSVWAAAGVLLAVATHGTSLAIGIGILYTLVLEGLVSAVFDGFRLLKPVIDATLRANTSSLVRPLGEAAGVTGDGPATDGPGMFTGPFVDTTQALVVLVVYLAVFLGVSGWLLVHRDVD